MTQELRPIYPGIVFLIDHLGNTRAKNELSACIALPIPLVLEAWGGG